VRVESDIDCVRQMVRQAGALLPPLRCWRKASAQKVTHRIALITAASR
jgi:hypothetical protein